MPQVAPAPKNPRRLSMLGALRVVDPDKWAAKVKRALRESDGHVGPASEALEISRRQLFRWLAEEKDGLLAGVKLAPTGRHRADEE